ncbi:MAG: hypothetical protein KFW07_03050 [Mycoplasmataceae bacterium]|nr:hypothetical protein [Mycoplasmataceae bacterium]
MKFKYIPGMRPTPMLMYYQNIEKTSFNEQQHIYKMGDFTEDFHHIWNMGSYFIYNDRLEIIAYRISNEYNFLWLLRILNKPIIINFNDDFIENYQNFFNEVKDELITM